MTTQRLIPILLALTATAISASPATVKGIVKDGEGEPLPGTTLQLISLPDTVRTAYMISQPDGSFSFNNIKKGKYVLLLSMTGMEDKGKNIEIKEQRQEINLGTITMSENAVMLKEAVVTGIKTAVIAKQDTIEFNADSFHTSPNSTVNELLKKLPGVEIGSDGSITSNGKSIKKILVDGKEFFGDDPQMATKNLPSNMVDKVQVVDRKSDFARLTGIDDGEEETVINLTVKKDMNNGWFGNASAGYGTDKRYQGSFVVNNFSNGNQITLLGGLNNINDNGFTDSGRARFRSFGGNNGINTSQRLGLNFNVGKDEIFRIGGDVLYSHSDRNSISRTATQNLYADNVTFEDANSRVRDKGHNLRSNFRLQWNIDPDNTIEFRPSLELNFRNSDLQSHSLLTQEDGVKVNSKDEIRNNRGTSVQTGGDFIFNHKFASRAGRSLSFQINYAFSNSIQKSTSWNDILYFLSQDNNDDDDSYYRFMDNHTWSNSIDGRISWNEPLGDVKRGNFLSFSYRLIYRWNNADQFTYNLPMPENTENFHPEFFDHAPAGISPDPVLSNSFRNDFFSQEFQVGYKKVTKSYNLDAGLLFSPSTSKSIDLINSQRNISRPWVWNVSPYARFRYRLGKQTSIRANYRARTSQPSMSQLQPVADVSDPLNVVVGNPDLKPTFTQQININFNDFKTESQQATFLMLNASYALNTIVQKTVTDMTTGGRTTTYGNVNGNLSIFGMGMITRPFAGKKWRFNARLNGRFASTPGYINGDYNRTGNLTLSPSGGITFSCNVFQMSVNPNYSFNRINNTLPKQQNRITHSYGFNTDVFVDLPFGLQLNTDLAWSNSSGFSAGFNSNQWLWNAQLSYSFLSDKSLTFSVRGYDLLGMKKNISRSVGANTIKDSEYNDLTRYVMFGLTWNFNTLKKKNKGPDGETDMMGPPPGGFRGAGRPMGPPPGGGGGRPPF